MSDVREISSVNEPVSGDIRPPGSKSITNRALILAALADGRSELNGVLDSHDTQVMLDSLSRLGLAVEHDANESRCSVGGCAGRFSKSNADLWLENSGTSIRFLASMCTVGDGQYRLDGVERMRERPIADLVRALNALGAEVHCEDRTSGCPPVMVNSSSRRLRGGVANIAGNISSQFLSGLLMTAPAAETAVQLEVEGELVSKPYVTMTLEMMKAFGVHVEYPEDLSSFRIAPQNYQPQSYEIEPDASAASYFFGAAAVTGGRVTVQGLTKNALQGDVHFASALEQMGCEVKWNNASVTVTGRPLHGVDIDMNAISDTAQTLSTVAVFADSPTTIRSVGHMRHKETDRITAVVTELRRAGIRAEEFDDGLRIYPGTPQPAEIQTYDDHRMAMSFSLLGLRAGGIRILDPGCTAKTYPNYFEDLEALCNGSLQA
ncbi:MAG TPA: 3-phosphoshikimate 1-carboxyvinyltransferase [Planctomycetes bacterium]|nr:3-phosphoshikimate 1-carboxyvinyltransferase [Fuerstiella sp.]HIK92440.1 3-phosphoshikimate 1-carboxyvinyltransferase [Planctomycetota bacterium]